MKPWMKWALAALAVLVAVFVVIQFLPFGAPIVSQTPVNPFTWASPEAEAVARKACYDCHSTEPDMWWLVELAPFKWMAGSDAQKGSDALNFSNWVEDIPGTVIAKSVDSGAMPPMKYWAVHWDAILSSADKATLVAGYEKSLPDNKAQPVPADVTAVVNARCGWCHSKSLATGYRAPSEKVAQAMLDRMVKLGAILNTTENRTLIDFYVTPTASRDPSSSPDPSAGASSAP